MLIDASHPEETRVVVVRGQRVEEFDFEAANRRQLRGNIYLAKVTRVEPSLQAAFVDYGGNRHGFLAFSEIHPDYYQIPVADRQALLEEEARHERDAEREEERAARRRDRRRGAAAKAQDSAATVSGEPVDAEPVQSPAIEDSAANENEEPGQAAGDDVPFVSAGDTEPTEPSTEMRAGAGERAHDEPADDTAEDAGQADSGGEHAAEAAEAAEARQPDEDSGAEAAVPDHGGANGGDHEEAGQNGGGNGEEDVVEDVGGADALEEVPERRHRPARRQYKIQEVIKRRQILLVQVVKEERGNKGAAMTTYLSLAGRYSVLMPNTARGGGISRKITSAEDRKRLREVAQELEVPQGMGIILRTAGASRTKAEIKRDYEYLMRMWESVRELTLQSSAPALVYEEGSLIKRAIRDLYNKDIDEVLVGGEEGYREAKDFMRMLMPSHAKSVKLYKEPQPLFAKHGIEAQLDAMFSNQVQLKSGGYLVINPTEALVSIDVNSGRSTREHNIEDTALRTNLEAAEEIARQLRLRDLAGLIVIDFIDMEEKRNNRAVEKKLKESLKNDRARIQVGHISPFGLLEMSRQRIRTGLLESSSIPCPHCAGTGVVRATASVALHLLRTLEETLIRSATHNLVVRTRREVAFYVLNQKRTHVHELESRFGVHVDIVADDSLSGTTVFAVDRGEPAARIEHKAPATGIQIDAVAMDEVADIDEADAVAEPARDEGEGESNGEGGRRRRRRRRRRGRPGEVREERLAAAAADEAEDIDEAGEGETDETADDVAAGEAGGDLEPRREGRHRGRRSRGRRPRWERGRDREESAERSAFPPSAPEPDFSESAQPIAADDDMAGGTPLPEIAQPSYAAAGAWNGEVPAEPAPPRTPEPAPEPVVLPEPEPVAVVLTPPDPDRPKRAGWWSKAKSALGGS
jgi:ribonuclease E